MQDKRTCEPPLDAHPDVSSTTRTGGSSGLGWRTSITRSVLRPSGIVSPGSHFGATVVNVARVGGCAVHCLKEECACHPVSFRGAGRQADPTISRELARGLLAAGSLCLSCWPGRPLTIPQAVRWGRRFKDPAG